MQYILSCLQVSRVLCASTSTLRSISLRAYCQQNKKSPSNTTAKTNQPQEPTKAGRVSVKEVDQTQSSIIRKLRQSTEEELYYQGRELNLVVYNLHDSHYETAEELAIKMRVLCQQVDIPDEFDCNLAFSECLRLGRPQAIRTKPRPVLVTCNFLDAKRWILAHKWTQHDYDAINNGEKFFIAPDRVQSARDKDYQLRQRLKEAKLAGEDAFIYQGELIKGKK